VFPDGHSLRVYQDAARTRALLGRHDARDAAGWDRLYELYERFAPVLFELYGARLPSAWAALRLARARPAPRRGRPSEPARLVRGRPSELAQLVMSSTRELGDAFVAAARRRR
jgi:phytoene dehydrogenase-like protein